jgi:hypothetical protein
MKSQRINTLILLIVGIVMGFFISQSCTFTADAERDVSATTSAVPGSTAGPTRYEPPTYEYAYGWGILETEGDAIYLSIPELETIDGEWGEMEVYKTLEFGIGFEGGAVGTEMYAINQIADLGWELVCKYYIPDGYEKGHHYWFRRAKK